MPRAPDHIRKDLGIAVRGPQAAQGWGTQGSPHGASGTAPGAAVEPEQGGKGAEVAGGRRLSLAEGYTRHSLLSVLSGP